MANGLFAGGSGIIEDPFLIEDAADLNAIRDNSTGKYYKLIDDINLSVSPYDQGWTPIPNFSGELDGNGYVVSGLYINNPETNNQAFISNINGLTTIKNIGFENVNITGKDSIGGFVATVSFNGFKIKDCFISGNITATNGIAGSFIAKQEGRSNLLIENSYSTCKLDTKYGYSGGFAALVKAGSNNKIRYSYFNGTMYALDYTNARAIVGSDSNTVTITDTYYNMDNLVDVPRFVGNGSPILNEQFSSKDAFKGWEDIGSYENIKTWFFSKDKGPILWYQSMGYYFLENSNGFYTIKNGELELVSETMPTFSEARKTGIRFLDDIHVDNIQQLKSESDSFNVVNIVRDNFELGTRELKLITNIPVTRSDVEITSDVEELDDNILENEAGKYKYLVLDVDNSVEINEIGNEIIYEEDNTSVVDNFNISIAADTALLNDDRQVDIFGSKYEEIKEIENEISDPYAVAYYDTENEFSKTKADVSYEIENRNDIKSQKSVVHVDNGSEHAKLGHSIEYREYNTVDSLSEFILTFEAEAISKYMISRDDGATWWTIQKNAWQQSKLDDINIIGMSIEDINKESIWRSLPTQSSDKIKIAVGVKNDILNSTHSVEKFVIEFAPNSAPTVNDLVIIENPQDITVEALLKDFENDNVEYRVLIKKAYEDEFFQVTPKGDSWYKRQNNHKLSHKYSYANLKTGINEVKVEVKDSRGDSTERSSFIMYQSGKPQYKVNKMNEFNLDATLNHTKGKEVAFRILINGVQVSPKEEGFSEFYPTPHHLHYVWDSEDLFIGITNNVTIEVTDVHDNVEIIENSFVGVYKGLLFKNELGTYYSSDRNEVIHRLDFGTIVGGLDSYPSKIILDNRTGFDVENIKIWVDPEIPEEKISLKLGLTEDELMFDSLEEIMVPDVLAHGEEFTFYARVETEVDSVSIKDKIFKIYANGDPYISE